jgi:hypothetical protein
MAYFPDLSPYTYVGPIADAVNVGWLDGEHEFPKGSVSARVLEKLKALAATPMVRHRGFHCCEFCGPLAGLRWPDGQRRSSTVFVVRSRDRTYAAPALVVHYIEAHGYLPPLEFLRALEEEPNQAPATSLLFTPRAVARATPSRDVAHL